MATSTSAAVTWALLTTLGDGLRAGTLKPGDDVPTVAELADELRVRESLVQGILAQLRKERWLEANEHVGSADVVGRWVQAHGCHDRAAMVRTFPEAVRWRLVTVDSAMWEAGSRLQRHLADQPYGGAAERIAAQKFTEQLRAVLYWAYPNGIPRVTSGLASSTPLTLAAVLAAVDAGERRYELAESRLVALVGLSGEQVAEAIAKAQTANATALADQVRDEAEAALGRIIGSTRRGGSQREPLRQQPEPEPGPAELVDAESIRRKRQREAAVQKRAKVIIERARTAALDSDATDPAAILRDVWSAVHRRMPRNPSDTYVAPECLTWLAAFVMSEPFPDPGDPERMAPRLPAGSSMPRTSFFHTLTGVPQQQVTNQRTQWKQHGWVTSATPHGRTLTVTAQARTSDHARLLREVLARAQRRQ